MDIENERIKQKLLHEKTYCAKTWQTQKFTTHTQKALHMHIAVCLATATNACRSQGFTFAIVIGGEVKDVLSQVRNVQWLRGKGHEALV